MTGSRPSNPRVEDLLKFLVELKLPMTWEELANAASDFKLSLSGTSARVWWGLVESRMREESEDDDLSALLGKLL